MWSRCSARRGPTGASTSVPARARGSRFGAWAFGSKPLYPVAIGLIVAALFARLWTRLAGRPVAVRRRLPQAERYEGDDVQVRLEVELERPLAPAALVVRERISKLGERE